MENKLRNLTLLSIIIFSLTFIRVTGAQTKLGSTEPTVPNFRFDVGKQIGLMLKGDGCTAFSGVVIDADSSSVTFSINERLTGNGVASSRFALSSTAVSPSAQYLDKYPRANYVNLRRNVEAIVLYWDRSDETGEHNFIISDKELFPGIKRSIELYNKFRQNPKSLLDAPDVVKASDDSVFLGFVVEFLSTGGSWEYKDYTVAVLLQLIEGDQIPVYYMGSTSLAFQAFLTGDFNRPISPQTRNLTYMKLVELGSSDHKLAGEAIKILARVLNKTDVDLTSFLNTSLKSKLLENLHAIPTRGFSEKEREKFEKLLSTNEG